MIACLLIMHWNLRVGINILMIFQVVLSSISCVLVVCFESRDTCEKKEFL